MKNRIKFCKFVKVASKVLIGILIALAVLVVAALIFRACAPARENIAYASEADGIGVWEWNSELVYSAEDIDVYFDFVSNGMYFDNIGISYVSDADLLAMTYYNNVSETSSECYSNGFVDVDSQYRIIDIKTAPPAEFMTILRANATYQGGGTPTTYAVTKSIGNGSLIGPDTIEAGATNTYQIAPNTGYTYPQTVEVTFAEHTYDKTTGKITVFNPTEDIQIFVQCPAVQVPANTLQGKYTFLQFPLLPVDLGNYYQQKVDFATTDSAGTVTQWHYMVWTSEGNGFYQLQYRQVPIGQTEDDGKIETAYGRRVSGGTPTQPTFEQFWLKEEYQYVDFGSTPQEVAEQFYNWTISNAVPGDVTDNENFQLGYDFGKRNGIEEGIEQGKTLANSIVVENNASWRAGYEKGLADGADNSLLDGPKAIFSSVIEILNIDIFGIPGFTVGAIVAITVTLGVLLFILRIIRG